MNKEETWGEIKEYLYSLNFLDFDFFHMVVIARLKKMYASYTYGGAPHNSKETNAKISHQLAHLLDINAQIEYLRETTDYTPKKEKHLFAMFYSYLGKHITEWHDWSDNDDN